MLSIRFAVSRKAPLLGFVLLLGCRSFFGWVEAGPLPKDNLDVFRNLLRQDPPLGADDASIAAALRERRQAFRDAVKQLPSLGDVTRVLLMSEWKTAGIEEIDPTVSLEKMKSIVKLPDEAFTKEIKALLRKEGEDSSRIAYSVLAEVRRNARQEMEDRLERDIRFYLRSPRPVDRIAAANLIRDTMNNSRRQDSSNLDVEAGLTRPDAVRGTRFLRDSLRTLNGDVQNLLHDSDPEVQIAAVRALSGMESITIDNANALKPLLDGRQTNVAVRRATAQSLTNLLDVLSQHVDRGRPQPILTGVAHAFPVAVSGLADSDARVRRSCLEACQRATQIVEDLANERVGQAERLAVFNPVLLVLDRSMPEINRASRDPVPEVRLIATQVLEKVVLASIKAHRPNEPSSAPPGAPNPLPEPALEPGKPKQGVSLPTPKDNKSHSAAHSSQWAATREESRAVVTLEAPRSLRRVSYQAPPADELPAPARVDPPAGSTLESMVANLRDRDYRVRLAAVDVLETMGVQAAPAIPALVKALRDYNKFVRWASARTLGRLAPRHPDLVVPGLTALLNDREDQSVRITAAYALELYGPDAKAAVPHLARVINRGDKEYVVAVLRAIQGIGSDAVPALPNVAWVMRDRDQSSSVRVEAAQTLARFGPLASEQIAVLRNVMVNDPDEAVRNAASAAVLAIDRPAR